MVVPFKIIAVLIVLNTASNAAMQPLSDLVQSLGDNHGLCNAIITVGDEGDGADELSHAGFSFSDSEKLEIFLGDHLFLRFCVISDAGNLEHIAATMEKLKAKVSLYVDKASTRGSVEHRNTTATAATAPVLVPMTGGALRKKRHIAK